MNYPPIGIGLGRKGGGNSLPGVAQALCQGRVPVTTPWLPLPGLPCGCCVVLFGSFGRGPGWRTRIRALVRLTRQGGRFLFGFVLTLGCRAARRLGGRVPPEFGAGWAVWVGPALDFVGGLGRWLSRLRELK